jgi:hypothetical protein
MITCDIIIYNYESFPFLERCLHQIRRHSNPLIESHIYISEQSSKKSYNRVVDAFGSDPDITIVPMKALRSGYALDYILRFVPLKGEYLCSMDCDTFAMDDDWLLGPIETLKTLNLTWIGLRADFEQWYQDNGHPQKFFSMAPCFKIGRTDYYKKLALSIGFTMYENRSKINGLFDFTHDTWQIGYSDDTVPAHWYEDTQGEARKLSLGITGRLGITDHEGEYGRVIGNLVMHFCFSWTSSLHEDMRERMGKEFVDLLERIQKGITDELWNEILSRIKYSGDLQPAQLWKNYTIINL